MPFRLILVAVLVATGLACGSGGDRDADDLRIVFVTHGQPSDPFWSVVQQGARQAARETGVRVEYQAPESFDMVAMGQLIDAAVASRPHGLVVSLPDADALARPVRRAIDAGIPVISINSGDEAARSLGVLAHVGQTEYEAGYGGGERMAAAGIRKVLCVNHEVGNAAQDLRCQGFTDAVRKTGAEAEVLAVELADPTESQQRIEARLAFDENIDGMLTLGTTGAVPALRALRSTGRLGSVKLATFDSTPDVIDAIADGFMMFAIDQQQYLQGYLPVTLLALYLRNANTFPDTVIRTGPGFVTRENVERLRELTERGTR